MIQKEFYEKYDSDTYIAFSQTDYYVAFAVIDVAVIDSTNKVWFLKDIQYPTIDELTDNIGQAYFQISGSVRTTGEFSLWIKELQLDSNKPFDWLNKLLEYIRIKSNILLNI